MNANRNRTPKAVAAALVFFAITFSSCGGGGTATSANTPVQPAPMRWQASQTVNCAAIENPIVIVILGQSQVANGIPDKNAAYNTVYSFWSGQCHAAVDPLPGSELTNGTIASRLGDRLTARSGRNILIVNYGASGTSIAQWLPGTQHNNEMLAQLDALSFSGFDVDALLWMQGETDCVLNTTQAQYAARFGQLLSSIRTRTSAPVMAAVETYVENRTCDPVRAAQRSLPNADLGVYRGPDIDALGAEYRRQDGTHFTTAGAERVADMWADYL